MDSLLVWIFFVLCDIVFLRVAQIETSLVNHIIVLATYIISIKHNLSTIVNYCPQNNCSKLSILLLLPAAAGVETAMPRGEGT